MLIQYGINSLMVLGMDMQILSHRNLELEVKDTGSFCWPGGLRCKCVSCGVNCFIYSREQQQQKSVLQRRKDEKDLQGEAKVKKGHEWGEAGGSKLGSLWH